MKLKVIYLILGLAITSDYTLAAMTKNQETQFFQGVREAQRGRYLKASGLLETLPQEDVRVSYFLGLSLHGLHQNSKAELALLRAQRLSKGIAEKITHLDFLTGQVLYEQKKFLAAVPFFLNSATRGHMAPQSLFFAAYSLQVAAKLDEAKKVYDELLKRSDASKELRQAALFQKGEIFYSQRNRVSIRDEVIPTFELALAEDPNSELAPQIRERFARLYEESKVHDASGTVSTRKPQQFYVFRIAQSIKYDTNVMNEPDQRIFKVSNKASALSVTSLFAKVEARPSISSATLILSPEFAFDATYHANRGNLEIFANDNLSFTPALRTRLEHEWGGRSRATVLPAAFLLDLELGYNTRDLKSEHSQLFFSRSLNPVVGYRILFPQIGVSQLKANIKLNENVNRGLNYFAPGVTGSQTFFIGKNSHALNLTMGMEQQWTNLRVYSQKNYRLGAGYSVPPIYYNTSADLNMQFTLIDTLNQLPERGYEKEYSPSLTLTHYFVNHQGLLGRLALQGGYSFTTRTSKDREAYAYSKHLFSAGVMLTL